jgi:hypothetical protein
VTEHVHPVFIAWAGKAIRTLQESNLNDALIASVVTEIRSAAIAEERLRMESLMAANPPCHAAWPGMARLLHDRCPRAEAAS